MGCGSSPTFNAGISQLGSGTISYVWRTNGVAMATNATGSMTLTSVRIGTAPTNIVVEAGNAYGSATNACTLAVQDAITLTLNGANPMSIIQGGTYIEPGVTATDPCAGSLSVTTNGTVNTGVVGTNTITYTATDGYTSATNTRTVYVTAAAGPAITSLLTNQNVQCGGNATFTTLATGTEPLSYTWSVNGTPVTSGTDLTSFTTNNVHTAGSTYTIAVTVTNAYGTNSSSATLTVIDTIGPVITVNGANPVWVIKGGAYTEQGAAATDACMGNVPIASTNGTVNVNVPGNYTVTYTASDGNGNTNTATRTVIVSAGAPNVIFILTDDMGWGDLGVFYQNSRNFTTNRNKPAFATPKLDTLATEGIQLRRHYTAAPVCAPARSSLLCGVTQGHSGVRDNQFDWPLENNHTLATVLKQAGYATAIIGKYGLDGYALGARTAGPMLRGFDYFFGYLDHMDGHYHYPKEDNDYGVSLSAANAFGLYDGTNNIIEELDLCYTANLWTARAKKYIMDHQATNAAQPFFIYLAYETPHAELEVPPTAYPAGGGTNGGVQWIGTPHAMINTATGTYDTWIHPDYTNATWDADNNPATAEVAWPAAEKRFATSMRRLDDCVGDLMQTLKDLGCDSNTIVVFTSDNGPHNEGGTSPDYYTTAYVQDPTFFESFGPMDGIKRDSWEGGMRKPTLVRWPGYIPAGATNMTASQFQDWMPTFAELAGLPAPARSDGVSLCPP